MVRIICQVYYGTSVLYAGIHNLSDMPEFKGDFVLPDNVKVGPIDCRILALDEDNNLLDYKVFMAPASPKMVTRMLNVNILTVINTVLQSQ